MNENTAERAGKVEDELYRNEEERSRLCDVDVKHCQQHMFVEELKAKKTKQRQCLGVKYGTAKRQSWRDVHLELLVNKK